jgi:AraC-like DNA-binding protein
MNFTELFKLFEFAAVVLLIVFSVFILSQKKGNKFSRYFLALFLISRAIILFGYAFWNYPELKEVIPDLFLVGKPFLYLYAPFLFLYTQSATTNNYNLKWTGILHFLPFLIILFYLLFSFHLQSFSAKIEMVKTGSWTYPLITSSNWLWAQFGIYAIGCIFLLVRYKKNILKYNSSYNRNKFSWLNILVIAFLVWKAIFVSGYLFRVIDTAYFPYFKLFIEIGFLFYASMIILKGLQLPKVVLGVEGDKMYQTSPLTVDKKENYLQKLEDYMTAQKPYFNPELTLKDLAIECGIPEHHVSQVINEKLNQNFYSYINKYRIEEAKQMLSDPENKEMTILEILYHVGFNSKSVFNTAFKKHVNMTPSSFKKQHLRIA